MAAPAAMDLSALHANYQPINIGSSAPQAAPKAAGPNYAHGLLGFVQRNAPTILGGVGAVAGSVLPGAGTLAGGALGSALGETLKRGTSGQKLDAKQIGIQGAIGAVPGLFKGARALKAGKAAVGAAGASRATPTASGAIQTLKTGATDSANKVIGLTPGAKVNGSVIGQKGVDKYSSFLKDEVGVKPALPQSVNRAVETHQAKTLDQMNKLVDQHNAPLSSATKTGIVASIKKPAGLDIASHPLHQEYAKDFAQVKDLKGLEAFRKEVDGDINYAKNSATPDAATAKVASAWRQAIDAHTKEVVPGLKDLKGSYATSKQVGDLLAKEASKTPQNKSLLGTTIPGSGKLVQKITAEASPRIEKILEKAPTGEKAMASTSSTGGVMSKLTSPKALAKGVGAQELSRVALGGNDSTPSSQSSAATPADTTSAEPAAATPDNPYPIENMLADVQRDPKNASTYQSIYKTVAAAIKPDKTSNQAAQAQAAGTQALSIVDNLEKTYNKAGGAEGRVPGLVASLSGKAGFNNNVNVYNDDKQAFLSNIARSLGEKGVLTDQDISRIAKAIPGPTANSGEATAKWALIRTIIGNGIKNSQAAYSTQSSAADATNALLQSVGAQ